MREHTVKAHNWATASENKIHDDAVARKFGFGGGLVPGVAVFAYMTHPAVEEWGRSWLESGRISTRFAAPVYEGDPVTVTMADDGALELRNPDDAVCATGAASLGAGHPPEPDSYLEAPTPGRDRRPPASPESLAPGTILATQRAGFHAELAGEYLESIGETHPIYASERVAHPGYLLLAANTALSASVRLGPWIHVESDVTMYAAVPDGAVVTTRARVERLFDRGGHRFVELAVLVSASAAGAASAVWADDRPCMHVRHTAIYEPRRAG